MSHGKHWNRILFCLVLKTVILEWSSGRRYKHLCVRLNLPTHCQEATPQRGRLYHCTHLLPDEQNSTHTQAWASISWVNMYTPKSSCQSSYVRHLAKGSTYVLHSALSKPAGNTAQRGGAHSCSVYKSWSLFWGRIWLSRPGWGLTLQLTS